MKVEKSWEDSKSLERSPFIGGSLFSCPITPCRERKDSPRNNRASGFQVIGYDFAVPIYKLVSMSAAILKPSISVNSMLVNIINLLFFMHRPLFYKGGI